MRQTWEKYASAWKTTDNNKRLAIFSKVLAKNAIYTDPLVQTHLWCGVTINGIP